MDNYCPNEDRDIVNSFFCVGLVSKASSLSQWPGGKKIGKLAFLYCKKLSHFRLFSGFSFQKQTGSPWRSENSPTWAGLRPKKTKRPGSKAVNTRIFPIFDPPRCLMFSLWWLWTAWPFSAVGLGWGPGTAWFSLFLRFFPTWTSLWHFPACLGSNEGRYGNLVNMGRFEKFA